MRLERTERADKSILAAISDFDFFFPLQHDNKYQIERPCVA